MLDLCDHEAAVYRALLRRPAATADELAETVRMSTDSIRRHLARLVDRGLAEPDGHSPSGIRPYRPDLALAGLLRDGEEALARDSAHVRAVRSDVADAVEDYLAGRELSLATVDMERLDGLAAIRAHMNDLVAKAQSEMLAIVTEFDDDPDAVDAARDEDMDILARGVSVRTIYSRKIREMPITWAYAAETARLGEEIRLSDELPTRMIIVDRGVAVIPADPNDLDTGALVVHCQPVVRAFVSLFEMCWSRATPVFGTQATRSPREGHVLDLLGTGAKDETAARHLGCDVRTIRRIVASLMDQLDASTRFQAGVEAVRRGWL